MSLSIVAMIGSLLLPAIQASRERARIIICGDHLRQLVVAALNNESAQGALPSGGWGYRWYGDPDRGAGPAQPGGWPFSLLHFVEHKDLARMGAGLDGDKKKAAVATVNQSALSLFVCPSRRGVGVYPFHPAYPPFNAAMVPAVAKGDYAINGGDVMVNSFPGPKTLADGDSPGYSWPDMSKSTGICHLRSEVSLAQIRDGTSHTYMLGEKYLSGTDSDSGDDQALYVGYDWDTVRWANNEWLPLPDGSIVAPERFGSAHPLVCQFAFCDGSVRAISFEIDGIVHRRLGNRQDGLLIGDRQY